MRQQVWVVVLFCELGKVQIKLMCAEKQEEKTKKEAANVAAEAERAAKQAQMEREAIQRRQIIEATPGLQRLWPHALYHLDYELRSNPQAVDFQLNSSLPKILANERNRLLEKSRNEWASRVISQLQEIDSSSNKSGDIRTARTSLLVQLRKLKLLGVQVSQPPSQPSSWNFLARVHAWAHAAYYACMHCLYGA
jgi:hypothetical protein